MTVGSEAFLQGESGSAHRLVKEGWRKFVLFSPSLYAFIIQIYAIQQEWCFQLKQKLC